MKNSYIILDRDGVINRESSEYIKTPEEWEPIPGSLEAITELNRSGYKVLVATNQSGVARGYYDLPMLDMIHDKMHSHLEKLGGRIDEVFFCPHHPDENCVCRKPQPGMLFQIKKKYKLNFEDTFFIGDSLVDIEAAQKVKCKPILVLTGRGNKTLNENPALKLVPHFSNLAAAVKSIL